MKEIKSKLLSQLMQNSKMSDRELAKKLGVSQPTASRLRAKLEEQGYIKEYTFVPDFAKLGFEIMALNFVRLSHELTKEETLKIRKFADEFLQKSPHAILLAAEGMGCEADRVIITFHENYSAYSKFVKAAKENPIAQLYNMDSFMISLSSGSHYQPLTFSRLAKYLTTMRKE